MKSKCVRVFKGFMVSGFRATISMGVEVSVVLLLWLFRIFKLILKVFLSILCA